MKERIPEREEDRHGDKQQSFSPPENREGRSQKRKEKDRRVAKRRRDSVPIYRMFVIRERGGVKAEEVLKLL